MSPLDSPPRPTLASYVRHLARHGPEHLLDTAQSDLSPKELAELADVIDRRPDRADVIDTDPDRAAASQSLF
jgi:hypothetical protein